MLRLSCFGLAVLYISGCASYAVLSLTLVRMLPVFLSLAGMKLRSNEKLFMGWFGPRGLASIVHTKQLALA